LGGVDFLLIPPFIDTRLVFFRYFC
jgi:hypothetical protein